MVNFNYVSSPKFMLNQKVLLNPNVCRMRIKFRSFWSFPTLPKDGQTRLLALWINPKWRQLPTCLCKNGDIAHGLYFRVSFCSTFYRNACISQISRRPIESRTAPLATVAINAHGHEWIITWNCFRSVAQQTLHTTRHAGWRHQDGAGTVLPRSSADMAFESQCQSSGAFLCRLFNWSLQHGTVPPSMKSTYVTPILNRIGRSPIYRCFRSHWNDSCLNSLWHTSEKTTYCQIVNQLTEHIIRQNPLCSEFCQTFCLHLILATLQFWRYSTCQLHLTASTIARYFNGCKLLRSWRSCPGLVYVVFE